MGGAQGTWGGTGHHGGGTSDVGGTGTRAPWGATWDTGVPGHTGGRGFPLTPPPPQLGFFKRSGPYGTAMEKAQLKPQAASEA